MPRSPRDRSPSDPDQRLFEAAMADARPLRGPARLVAPPPPPTPAAVKKVSAALARPAGDAARDSSAILRALERPGDGFAFAVDGLDRRVIKELENGARRPEATLDLHGARMHEAEARLDAFIRGAAAGGRRLVLVIHGRGLGSGREGPVLRQVVHDHLTKGALARAVLAVVAAPARLGGSGAALVLLRRNP